MSIKSQKLLLDHVGLLQNLPTSQPVLDLACGNGRNGLLLAQKGIPVVFADRSVQSLEGVKQQLETSKLPGRTWHIDLEQKDTNPLEGQSYSAIIGFRYLHRPLFPALMRAVMPGGIVIYETFTTANRKYGRPNNPDFLLKPGELRKLFEDWEIVFYFEGDLPNPDRNVAQLVVRKPV
jgi:tellurite methyltransferase